ncbi:MAG: SPASM domain-containing protein [Candidatus Aenigmarchaeota archaeon]|nr:SPASM domain-containing protein [Candidatus Aenigmarchaeota archaeon]
MISKTKENTDVCVNEYFSERLGSKYLVTTRHGGFAFLSREEYDVLFRGTFTENDELFKKLNNVGILISKENIKNIIFSFEKQLAYFLAPKAYMINLSNECNLMCKYCHANATPDNAETMAEEIMDKTIKFMASSPAKGFYIEFQGGEPLAKFNGIKKFMKKLNASANETGKKIISAVIVSNMTLMTEEIAKFIIENNIGICSSLDGPKELHDLQRQYVDGSGSYDLVTKWLAYLKDHKKTVNILPTITSYSIKFGAKKIVDEYVKLGARRVMFRPVYCVGRGKANKKELAVPAEEFVRFWKESIDYMVELTEKGTLTYDSQIQSMLRNMTGFPRSYMCMRMPCGAGISQASISPDGTIFPCDLAKTMPDLALGNVNESYLDVFSRAIPMYARTAEANPLCDTCAFSAYCGICYSRTYATFRDIIPRTPVSFECKVNKAMFTYLFEKLQDERYKKVFEQWVRLKR